MGVKRKYKILKEESRVIDGRTVYRIKALRSFDDVQKGDLGGFVQSEDNLSHTGESWIYDDAAALDESYVNYNARMYGNSRLYDQSRITGDAIVEDNAVLRNFALMDDDSRASDNSTLQDDAALHEKASIEDNVVLSGNTLLLGYISVLGNVKMYNCFLRGSHTIQGDLEVYSTMQIFTFYDNWFEQNYFTYTLPNKKWSCNKPDFYGSEEDFIKLISGTYGKIGETMVKKYVEFAKGIEEVAMKEYEEMKEIYINDKNNN